MCSGGEEGLRLTELGEEEGVGRGWHMMGGIYVCIIQAVVCLLPGATIVIREMPGECTWGKFQIGPDILICTYDNITLCTAYQ